MRYHECEKHGTTEVSPTYEGPTVCVPCLENRRVPTESKDAKWARGESVMHIGQAAAIGAIPCSAALIMYLGARRSAFLMVPLAGLTALVFMGILILWWRSKERR